jgi:hypothetical protein
MYIHIRMPSELDTVGFEYVVHRLLIAELQPNVDIHLLSDHLKDKMRYIRNWRGVYNARALCEGFAWEASSSNMKSIITALTPEEMKMQIQSNFRPEEVGKESSFLKNMYKNEDSFLESLRIGKVFLTQDWLAEGAPLYYHYTIKEGIITTTEGDSNNNKRCLSPASFIALAEKYTVLALMYSEKCENVLLPKSLILDVLCRQNDAYGNMVHMLYDIRVCGYIYLFVISIFVDTIVSITHTSNIHIDIKLYSYIHRSRLVLHQHRYPNQNMKLCRL